MQDIRDSVRKGILGLIGGGSLLLSSGCTTSFPAGYGGFDAQGRFAETKYVELTRQFNGEGYLVNLEGLKQQVYRKVGANIYNYNDMVQTLHPQQSSMSSSDLSLLGFLFGAVSFSPAISDGASALSGLAGNAFDREARIEGQKETARILTGQNNFPQIKQKFLPYGNNGISIIRDQRGDSYFFVSKNQARDIDGNGIFDFEELLPVGIGNQFENLAGESMFINTIVPPGQMTKIQILKEDKLHYVATSGAIRMGFEGLTSENGNYKAVISNSDGIVMAVLPYQIYGGK